MELEISRLGRGALDAGLVRLRMGAGLRWDRGGDGRASGPSSLGPGAPIMHDLSPEYLWVFLCVAEAVFLLTVWRKTEKHSGAHR